MLKNRGLTHVVVRLRPFLIYHHSRQGFHYILLRLDYYLNFKLVTFFASMAGIVTSIDGGETGGVLGSSYEP